MNPYPDEFGEQVRECLAHLYDFSVLQNNPIVKRLGDGLTGTRQVQAARQIIIDQIEGLKLQDKAAIHSRQSRPYLILTLRYVEEMPVQEILHELALSPRQFYREHRRSLDALAQILWFRMDQRGSPTDNPSISIQSEISRAYNHRPEGAVQSSYRHLVLGAIQAVDKLAEQRNIHIRLTDATSEHASPRVPHSLVRQFLIWLFAWLLQAMNREGEICLRLTDHDEGLLIDVSGIVSTLDPSFLQTLIEDETWCHFAERLGVQYALSSEEAGHFNLMVPYKKHTILVIDDNPDVVDLFRRYATSSRYQVIGAADGSEGIRLALSAMPSLIVLDVMLPEHDGWETLQRLKSNSTLQSVPVFVCSVLDTAELALSLGAQGFLKKPPSQLAFLTLLDQSVASTG